MSVIDAETLASRVHGEVLTPVMAAFPETHAGFNLAEVHAPDVVVRPADTQDVRTAVRAAASAGIPVRVQATGHGKGRAMNGGMLIATDRLRQVQVDPVARTVRAAAGARWSDVLSAAAQHHLTGLCGSAPDVGVVGYTLGGGMGPMASTFGFNADLVRTIELVDAEGHLRQVTAESEPELFWALRGGKPHVGVVTAIELGLVDVPVYFGGAIFYPGERAAEVLHTFRQWAPTLPTTTTTSIALLRLPDDPTVPEPLRGQLSVHLRYVHVGEPARGARLLAPMRQTVPPVVDLVDLYPAEAIGSVHQDPTDPVPARERGVLLADLTAETVDRLLAVAGPGQDLPLVVVELRLMGGAIRTPPPSGSAVGGRAGAYHLFVVGICPPPLREAVDGATGAVLAAVAPWTTGGTLINFQGVATTPAQVRSAWPGDLRRRLDRVTRTWDPDGLFQFAYPA